MKVQKTTSKLSENEKIVADIIGTLVLFAFLMLALVS